MWREAGGTGGKWKLPRYWGISQSSVIGKLRQEDKKEREVVITDVAIPGDDRVKDKELQKLEKYQLLRDEIAKVWRMQKVIVVPVVIGALGAISVHFKDYNKYKTKSLFTMTMNRITDKNYAITSGYKKSNLQKIYIRI